MDDNVSLFRKQFSILDDMFLQHQSRNANAPLAEEQDTKQPTAESVTPSGTFVLFPELPFELQLRIWEHAVADIEPRIVEATFSHASPDTTLPSSPAHTPALLHACTEARMVALHTYSLLEINQVFTGAVINFGKDTLFFTTSFGTNHAVREIEPGPWMSKCRRLALADICYWAPDISQQQPSSFLAQFEKLDDLTVVYLRNECVDVWNSDFTVSYGTGDIVKNNGSMSFGPGSISLGPACANDKRCSLISRHLSHKIFHNPNIKSGSVMVISKGYHRIDKERTAPIFPETQYCAVCARYSNPSRQDVTLWPQEHSYAPLLLDEDPKSKAEFEVLTADDKENADMIAEMIVMGEEHAAEYPHEVAN